MKRLLAISVVAASAFGCAGPSGPALAPNVTAAQQHSASESMGISFPPETQFLLYHRETEEPSLLPVPDDCVHLKLQLPSAVASKMLAKAPFDAADWGVNARHVNDVPAWKDWRPSHVTRFRSAQIPLPQAECLNVLIDDDNEETKVVYLIWFET